MINEGRGIFNWIDPFNLKSFLCQNINKTYTNIFVLFNVSRRLRGSNFGNYDSVRFLVSKYFLCGNIWYVFAVYCCQLAKHTFGYRLLIFSRYFQLCSSFRFPSGSLA
ncbi:MAG: hypothetical protein ACI9GZ_004291 [Bacteroidia bacterium]|jgi:hypothetical protein